MIPLSEFLKTNGDDDLSYTQSWNSGNRVVGHRAGLGYQAIDMYQADMSWLAVSRHESH